MASMTHPQAGTGVGTFRAYTTKQPSTSRLEKILQAAAICEEYEAKGFTLTLRQLYYQHVARNLIPNNQREYDRLGDLVKEGRMCGLISWTAIEDRGRYLRGHGTYDAPQQAIAELAKQFKLDLWADQPVRPEVWVEKDALIGVLSDICGRLRVNFLACKGYNSASEMWRAGGRMRGYLARGQRPVVLYLGDHDPSGLQMTEDLQSRLATFAGAPVQVVRLALNREQIDRLRLPPNPAKKTDSRYGSYAAEHGEDSWELDALPLEYVQELISVSVSSLRADKIYDAALAREVRDREWLTMISEGGE